MIISILTILFVIILHMFPKRIRVKLITRIKRVFNNLRKNVRSDLYL